MEFWGVEVKSGEPLKVQPQIGKLIHISQAALGEVKDVKGAKHVPLRLKIDDKSFIIGSLSAEARTQLIFDLVFEREFELSHDWKNGSVYFIGYIADDSVSGGDDFSDESEDESEDEPVHTSENGHMKPKIADMKAAKNVAAAKAGTKKEKQPVSDEDDSEFDSHDEMTFSRLPKEDSSDVSADDSEKDTDGSFSSEEELPKQTKKRPAESAQGPALAKKAKSATPDNTGNKKGRTTTPSPLKKAGKGSASNKSNKSGGQMSFKSRNK